MKKKQNALKSFSFLIVCIVLGIAISLQIRSINAAQNVQVSSNKRLNEVQEELLVQTRINRELADRYAQLSAYVEALETQTFESDDAFRRIMEEKRNAEIFAGLTEVTGPGVTITLTPAEDSFIRDSDLRSVVNELRASGAQAISINDERMVAISEIREAGRYIVINGKQFSADSQFSIKSISRPDEMERAIEMVGGVGDRLKIYSIDFTLTKSETVTIPRLREDSPAYKMDMLK